MAITVGGSYQAHALDDPRLRIRIGDGLIVSGTRAMASCPNLISLSSANATFFLFRAIACSALPRLRLRDAFSPTVFANSKRRPGWPVR